VAQEIRQLRWEAVAETANSLMFGKGVVRA
jgi:hypothetical protein